MRSTTYELDTVGLSKGFWASKAHVGPFTVLVCVVGMALDTIDLSSRGVLLPWARTPGGSYPQLRYLNHTLVAYIQCTTQG